VLIRDDSAALHLQRFPFNKIKIDRSFVRDIESDNSRDIVQAIVEFARARQIITTAEGVETESQRAAVQALGRTEMQGYLISQPAQADKLAELLPLPSDMPLARAS
jgi:EAL domain-containing protein (putative c-di-GMP-specific phosphodiesterase class I)